VKSVASAKVVREIEGMGNRFQFFREAPRKALEEKPPDLSALAALLCEGPVEVRLEQRGLLRGGELLPVSRQALLPLLRRNIHSLLARWPERAQVEAALETAVAAPVAETERALEEAGLLFNLSEALFVAPEATVRFDGTALAIESESGEEVVLGAGELKRVGADFFTAEPLELLLALGLSALRFSRRAVLPLHLQVPVGAVMLPGTAQALRKGNWRGDLLPDFLKEFCINCARCYVYCPDGAILHSEIHRETSEESGVLGIDYQRCTGCGTCEAVCPATRDGFRAMVMVSQKEKATRESHHVSAKR
jgi:2-oxoacid:acceptor oxidoreductase delta subunit (pyruvate/2-ketoisovalerate family)